MADEILRTFVAAELPESLREKIEALQKYLKRFNLGARWIKPEGLHLTLKFLGDTKASQLPGLETSLREAVAGTGALALDAAGLGVFPDSKKPRVLWVGLKGDTERCIQLAAKIDRASEAHGFPGQGRPFSPPLTVARFKKPPSPRALRNAMNDWGEHSFERVDITHVVLFESRLKASGAEYHRLASIPLGGAPVSSSG